MFARYLSSAEPELPEPFARAGIYRRLVRANLRMVVARAFPVARSVLGEEALDAAIAGFLEAGGPKTSFYREIPGDFVGWAQVVRHPFRDLFHYEWIELVASRHPADLDTLAPLDRSDLIRPNPTMQIGVYGRPVHAISAANPSPEPFSTETAYLVWRRPRSDNTAVHRAGLLIARALAIAAAKPVTVEDLVAAVAESTSEIRVCDVRAHIVTACDALREKDGVLP